MERPRIIPLMDAYFRPLVDRVWEDCGDPQTLLRAPLFPLLILCPLPTDPIAS